MDLFGRPKTIGGRHEPQGAVPHAPAMPAPLPSLPDDPPGGPRRSPVAARHPGRATTFLDPQVLARIESLELLARTVVEGFLSGLHRSPHLGFSVDFAEHRPYLPGDDIRRIDWRLFARTDRFYLKEFEADTNTNVAVILDVSPSMRFGSRGLTKLDYGRYLAACLLWFSHRQRDRVGLVAFDDAIAAYVPCGATHLPAVLHTLERLGGNEAGGMRDASRRAGYERPFSTIAHEFRRRSIIIVISDLYDEPERVAAAVGHLRGRGNDLVVMHVLDPAEREFPYEEATSFRDLESGESMPVVPEGLRDQYRGLVAAHVDALRRLTREREIDYVLFDSSQPLDHALFAYLAHRERMQRVR
jgi:uncharacterized protein (DUF58 family)